MRIKLGKQHWTRRLVNRLGRRGKGTDGDCLLPQRVIRIRRCLDQRTELETDIHEALHAQMPWLEEYLVERHADELAELLYDRLHYRKQES